MKLRALTLRAFARYASLAVGLIAVSSLAHARPVDGAQQDLALAMSRHMKMTTLRPIQPGDQQRADAIVAAARKVMERYTDYRKALASGYAILLPGARQSVYHFSRYPDFQENTIHFDPDKPASLLYARVPDPAVRYKLVGVMYTAPYEATEEELNRRVPLSIGRWHMHTNLCVPPVGHSAEMNGDDAKFGVRGSIVTADACQAAGGRFLPHYLGWMVHVYAFETDPSRIWVSGMDDEHGMQHDTMMPSMTM